MIMKRILILVAVFAFTMSASAQWSNILSSAFKSLTSSSTTSSDDSSSSSTVTDAVKGVLSNLLSSSVSVSDATLKGTWNYDGVSCVLESDQALANIGGSAIASKLESKLDTYLAKVGVAEGSCTFTFLDNDSCQFTVKGRTLNGTYTLDTENKTIAFSFYGRVNMTANVSYDLTTLSLVFNADKMLELIKKTTSAVSSSSLTSAASTTTTLSTISSLLENYSGLMLGMKLSK